MTNMLRLFLTLSSTLCLVLCQELLGNGDFETGNSISPWDCQDCHGTITQSSKYHGQHAVKVNNRHHDWSGIAQTMSIHGGRNYHCQAFIKILNTAPGKTYAKSSVMIKYNDGKDHYLGIGENLYHEADGKFTEIGGDFHIPSGISSARLYIQMPDPAVNYVLDYASCQQITHDPQWRTHANQRINNIRKGSLTINVIPGSNLNTNGLSVEIKQTKSKFALGTAFSASKVTDTNYKAYQDFLLKNFEWAVPENALKWKQMEWTRGHINYNKGMDAVNKLRSHGIKVRGHNMFWDDPAHVPDWVKGMSRADALQAMHKRVNDMISHSRGTLEHWDVSNENLHYHPFEEMLHNPRISEDMFKWIHAAEPGVKLFLNEFSAVTWTQTTTALKALGKRYKESGVPIYGLGAQGHFGSSHIDIDVVKYRLDKLAEAGLPIWITELTIPENDENRKASTLDDLMTLFFSHPSVEGVLLWGFWDGALYKKEWALATGSGVTPNAAGRKWLELFHQRFRTNKSHNFHGQTSFHSKVFYGDYQLVFKQNGHTIHTENLSFTHGSKTASVHLAGSGQNVHVSHLGFG